LKTPPARALMLSMDNGIPRIFAGLRDRPLRDEGIFIAEGRYLVERLLSSDLEAIAVLSTPRMAGDFAPLAGGRCPLIVSEEDEIGKTAGFRFHRGVMAAGRRPAPRGVDRFLDEHPGARSLVICAGIGSDDNLGSILRSAAAFGYDAVAVTPRGADPWSRKSLRASMGAPFSLPVITLDDEKHDIALMKERGFIVCATVLSDEARPLAGSRIGGRHALVLGNEAAGLDDAWREWCDLELTIPVSRYDSLNVGVAAGIFMYHMRFISGNTAAD